jgi:hypothetical protein
VMLQGGQGGNGAVASGQSCHRKGMFCHMADRVHRTGLVLSHGEQSCNRTGWCCHMVDRVVTGRERYLGERSGHRTSLVDLVVLPVTDRVPRTGKMELFTLRKSCHRTGMSMSWVGGRVMNGSARLMSKKVIKD